MISEYPRPGAAVSELRRRRARVDAGGRRVGGLAGRCLRHVAVVVVAAHRRGVRLRRAWLRLVGGARRRHRAGARCAGTILRRYLAFLTTRQYARRSIARKAAALRRYFKWLVRAGHLSADPTVGAAGARRRRPAAAGARPSRPRRAARRRDARGRTGLAAQARRRRAGGPLRLGAAGRASCAASTSARSTSPARAVTVWGKGAKERRVPLSAPAVAALRAWLRVRADVVVDQPDVAPTGAAAVRQRAGPAGSRHATCAASSIAARRRPPTRTPCGTASPPTCSTGARTSGPSRSCSATPTWPRRSATRTSAGSGCGRPTPMPTRAHERAIVDGERDHRDGLRRSLVLSEVRRCGHVA